MLRQFVSLREHSPGDRRHRRLIGLVGSYFGVAGVMGIYLKSSLYLLGEIVKQVRLQFENITIAILNGCPFFLGI